MTALEKVEELKLKLASFNEKILVGKEMKPRSSEHYNELIGVIVTL